MDRRDFLRLSAVGAAVGLGGRSVFGENGPVIIGGERDRFNIPACELEEATLDDLQKWMASGRMTSRSITQLYLNRIAALDRKGPSLHHVIEVNPDALSIAAALDKERKAGHVRGPLHGIPILLKDNVDTADRMTTTAGSLALAGSIPLQDSTVAAKLRAAGVVLLGKTNLSEWAHFRSSHSTSGWS